MINNPNYLKNFNIIKILLSYNMFYFFIIKKNIPMIFFELLKTKKITLN